MAGRVLTRSAYFVATQHQADVFVLPYEFGPHSVAIVVRSKSVILRVEAVASGNARVVEVLVSMGSDDDLSAGIVLNDLRSPGEGSIARVELERDNQVLLAIDRDTPIKVLIAPSRIAALPIRRAPVSRIRVA